MLKLAAIVRPTASLLLPALLATPWFSLIGRTQHEARVLNIRFQREMGYVRIIYDLVGDPENTYLIGVLLRRENEPGRFYRPKLLSGDFGEGVTPGKNRAIMWHMQKEIPAGLEGDDYYFVISVEEESGGFPWWMGATIVAAGVVGLLALLPERRGAPNKTLPPPPGRP